MLEYLQSTGIILLLQIITVVIGVSYILTRQVTKSIKLYVYFLAFSLFVDFLSLYVAAKYFSESNYFGFIQESSFLANFWQYNFISVVATCFHLYFFGRLLSDKNLIILLKVLGVAFFLSSILVFIFKEGAFFEEVSSYVAIVGSLLLLLSSSFYLMEILNNKKPLLGQKRFPIFIVLATATYHLASLPVFIYSYSEDRADKVEFIDFYIQVMKIIVIIVFLIYLSGFYICLSKKKNLIIYVSIFGVALVILFGLIFHTFYKVRRQMLLDKFSAERKHREEINSIVVEIQNQTLKNIGRELHDNIGQKLTLANLQLGMMKVGSKLEYEHQKLLTDTIQESIKDLRSLSKSLNSDIVEDNGLLFCIQHEISRLSRLKYIEVKLKTLGEPYRFNKEKELVLFRIFQEAINNSLKHSQASSFHIYLEYKSDQFKMYLEDNGIGFDLKNKTYGSGLRNMQIRAEIIHAALKIKSDNLNGTSLDLSMPI